MTAQAMRQGVSLLARIPGVAIVLALLIVGFTLANPNFATPGNIANLLVQSTLLTLLALPTTVVIMTEGLDLSIGAVLTLASIALALTVVATGSAALGILAGLAVGLGFGLLNGVLVASLNLPPFIATLGTLGIAQGLSLVVTDGQSVVGIPSSIERIYSGTLLGIPVPILLAAAAYGVVHVLLYRTRFGVAVFALGGNREALRLAGVSDRAMLIAVYALSGLIAGFAALLMTARLNAAHPTAGLGLEFDAIAAVAVGGTSFERGNGWLFGSLLGVIAVGVLRNGLNLAAVPSSTQVACIGALVIVALFIDALRSRA
ncbi:MAG: ABC transporter permease [Bradyrhizobiaceae bacterium]|jgi:ribose transport system permease protein|nr:ABC transporter permease [Bradyrhizobiaceae bacterium]